MSNLNEKIKVGDMTLANRIFMAPLTRCRAGEGDVPTDLNLTYYEQRASAGLIISEATNISPMSCAFDHAPGIWTDQQVAGWKKVTDAVHAKGGKIFVQLWHCGRVGAAGILNGNAPLSPSGLNDDIDKLFVYGQLDNGAYVQINASPSREMTQEDITTTIEEYRIAARNSKAAGFDGVEIHAANGYLPHQFLSPGTNQRTDKYGGDANGRAQFLREVMEAVLSELPSDRVGVRISPYAGYNNPADPDPTKTYPVVLKMLGEMNIAYLHVADTNGWVADADMDRILPFVKENYSGVVVGNGGLSIKEASTRVEKGDFHAAAFGRSFIANPDLPERIAQDGPYNDVRYVGFYGGDEEGYTDYPSL